MWPRLVEWSLVKTRNASDGLICSKVNKTGSYSVNMRKQRFIICVFFHYSLTAGRCLCGFAVQTKQKSSVLYCQLSRLCGVQICLKSHLCSSCCSDLQSMYLFWWWMVRLVSFPCSSPNLGFSVRLVHSSRPHRTSLMEPREENDDEKCKFQA